MRSETSSALRRIRSSLAGHYHLAKERDKEWVMHLDVDVLNKLIWPLFVGYICLTFLDVYTTTLAMNFGPLFHEENPIAAPLFNGHMRDFLLALAFKYLPAIPLFYAVFVQDAVGKNQVGIRTVKFSALIALAGADLLLLYIVGIHNFTTLLGLQV